MSQTQQPADRGERFVAVTLVTLLVASSIGGVITFETGVASAATSGYVEGTPHLNASAPDAQLSPGEDGTVSVSLTNNAEIRDNNETHPTEARERAGEARSIEVNISDTRDAPLTVDTGAQQAGTIQDGNTGGPYAFSVQVDDDATAGTYEVTVRSDYRHAKNVTYDEVADGEYQYSEAVVNRTETDTITVEIEPEPDIEVDYNYHDVPVGGEGIIAANVTNTGGETVTDATLSLTASDSDFYFGSGTATSETDLGELPAGESKVRRFRAGTVESAVDRPYPIDATVQYTDSEDNQASQSDSFAIEPHERTRFAVGEPTHDVPQGGEGTIMMNVTHTAGKDIEDVTVTATVSDSDVYLGSQGSRSSAVQFDQWGAQQARQLTFRAGTDDSAVNRSYPIELQFEYTDAEDNDNTRTTTVEFSPKKRSEFRVTALSHSVPQNGEGTVSLNVTQVVGKDVEDVTVTATAPDTAVYLGSESTRSATTQFQRWGNGDARQLTFRAGTGDSAVNRSYPIELQFEYTDDENNDNTVTEYVQFTPRNRTHFTVEDMIHDVPQSGEGTITMNVTHTAGKDIEDVTVTATASDSDVYLGSQGSRSSAVQFDQWGAQQARQLTFRAGTADSAVSRSYPIELQFEYTDDKNNDNTRTESVQFTPKERTELDLEILTHNVPRDGEGTVVVDAAHAIGEPVTDVQVTATAMDSEIYIGSEGSRSTVMQIDEWRSNMTREFRLRTGTTDGVVRQSYPIEFEFSYTDGNNSENTVTETVEFVPLENNGFEIQSFNHDIPQSGEGVITANITNEQAEEVADVTVTATASDPAVTLGTEASSTVTSQVGSWDSGERQQLTFRARTDESAVDRSYPIELQFEYTDDENNDNTNTEYIEFVPDQRAIFTSQVVEHTIPQNGEGTITFNVTPSVGKDIEDVTVTATATDTAVYLGSETSQSATTQFENWTATEPRKLTFRAGTDGNAVNRTYPIELQFDYTDDNDNDNTVTEYVQFTPQARPEFSVRTVAQQVPREGTGYLTVNITSAVPRTISEATVTATAPDSEVYLGSEASPSGTAFVETWDTGERKQLTFRPGTTENAVANRTYPIELEFQYTDSQNNDNTRTEYVQFSPQERPQFTVESVDHTVPIGDSGLVRVTLRNEGPLNATDATLTASSNVDALFFGTGGAQEPVEAPGGISFEPPETGTPTSAAYIGEWPAGETRTVTLRGGFDENAIEQAYTADLSVAYENENGDDMPTRSTTVGIEPAPEQAFAVERIESDLYVGEEGDLVGKVTNRANRTVEGVVVTVANDRQAINFYNTRYAVGRLKPGESATFRYRVGVTGEAEHGPKLFELSTRYRGSEGTVQQTDSQDLSVEVKPERDDFAIERTDGTFSPGGGGSLTLTVTNQRNETVSNVQAKLFSDDPLDSSDDEAFIASLGPGESTTVTFDLSVGASAMAKDYSVSVDFRYDNARGESQLSDTYRVPVTVETSDSGLGPLLIGSIVVVIVAIALLVWWFDLVSALRKRLGS